MIGDSIKRHATLLTAVFAMVLCVGAGLAGCKDLFHPEGSSECTVTFNGNGGTPATQTKTVDKDTSIGLSDMPTAPTRSGYTLGGWYTTSTSGGTQFTYSTTVTANITVYARWTASTAVPSTTLQAALTWLNSNAEAGGSYAITLSANESIGPKTLSYSGKKVSITLSGGYSERTISLSSNGSLFSVKDGVTLTLGNNVTLRGRSSNTSEVVQVGSGGTLVMETGSKITGNTAFDAEYNIAGGVYLFTGGTFTMNGGEISGNSASVGKNELLVAGGVYVSGGTFTMNGGTISGNTSYYAGGVCVGGGTFTKSGGTIYGSNASSSLKNTATASSNYGHAVFVNSSPTKKRNTTAGTGVTLNSSLSGSSGGWE